jgi:hypothetical protein
VKDSLENMKVRDIEQMRQNLHLSRLIKEEWESLPVIKD